MMHQYLKHANWTKITKLIEGVYIVEVVDDTAAKSRNKAGDVIIKVGDTDIASNVRFNIKVYIDTLRVNTDNCILNRGG